MLARSQSINPLGTTGGTSNGNNGNVIEKMSDDLVDEIKSKIKNEI